MTSAVPEFARVAEQVAPKLFRMARQMCRRPEDAEDLVQDALLQGFRKWGQFEGRADPATWLYTIATRLCYRRHRRRAGEPAHLESLSALLPAPSDHLFPLASPAEGPFDLHLRAEAERTVRESLAGLPPGVRLPLVLTEIAELSTAEVARILGLKEATVKTRVHRGRLRLRRALLDRVAAGGRGTSPPPVGTVPADHTRQVCLDLLRAKQEALDRHAPFPVSGDEMCARCRSVFAALDFSRDICRSLDSGELPAPIRAWLRTANAAPPSPRRVPHR